MAKQSKRGRPPGSPNRDYVEVEQVPPHCVRCGSTQLRAVRGAKVIRREIAGQLPSGFQYDVVTWARKRCECGQTLIIRSYYCSGPAATAAGK